MAKGKQTIVLMVPEDGDKKSYSYSFTVKKSLSMIREAKKLRLRRYDPTQRKHIWFVERKVPSHN
jgi:ribosomal protein L33